MALKIDEQVVTLKVKKKIIEITTVTINNLEKKAQKLQFSQ